MNGRTYTIRRRLSIVALAASIAAVAVPAASAGGGYQAGLVAGKLGSPDPRDTAQKNETFSPSVVDRLVGSPDPRDSDVSSQIYGDAAQEHGSNGFLGQGIELRSIVEDAAREHGAAGFANTTSTSILRTSPSVLVPDYSHLPTEDRP